MTETRADDEYPASAGEATRAEAEVGDPPSPGEPAPAPSTVPAPESRAPEQASTASEAMRILVIDVGGTHVKVKCNTDDEVRRVDSGPEMTAQAMVTAVR